MIESQTITSNQIAGTANSGEAGLRGFGFSLASNGLNLDNSGYANSLSPDLVIGTLADKIVVLRSRPLVKIVPSLEITNEHTKEIIHELDLATWNGQNCGVDNCVLGKFCFTVASELKRTVNLTGMVELDKKFNENGNGGNSGQDSSFNSPRLRFGRKDGTFKKEFNFSLVGRGKMVCFSEYLYLIDESLIEDNLNPVSIVISVFHEDYDFSSTRSEEYQDVKIEHYPKVVGETKIEQLKIRNNCGADRICHSNINFDEKSIYFSIFNGKNWTDSSDDDIEVSVDSSKTYLERMSDENNRVRLVVGISNDFEAEDAHKPNFRFVLPEGVEASDDWNEGEVWLTDNRDIETELDQNEDVLTFGHDKFVKNVSVNCTRHQIETIHLNEPEIKTEYTCTFDKTLSPGEKFIGTVPLDFSGSRRKDWANLKITVKIGTTSEQDWLPRKDLILRVKLDAKLDLVATSDVEQVSVNDRNPLTARSYLSSVQGLGPRIVYTMTLNNAGNLDLQQLELSLKYPTKFDIDSENISGDTGKPVLYLYKVVKFTTEDLDPNKGPNDKKIIVGPAENRENERNFEYSDVGYLDSGLVDPDGWQEAARRRMRRDSPRSERGVKTCGRGPMTDRQFSSVIRCGDTDCDNECETVFFKVPYLPSKTFVKVELEVSFEKLKDILDFGRQVSTKNSDFVVSFFLFYV